MTKAVRRAAGGLTILEAVWLFYWDFATPSSFTGCTALGCSNPFQYLWPLLPLGAILVVVGMLGVWGASIAYLAGLVLSAVAALLSGYEAMIFAGYTSLSAESSFAFVGVALAVVAALGNLVAVRKRSSLSEQAHPMNLPVFG
jgi:hypothetical protein